MKPPRNADARARSALRRLGRRRRQRSKAHRFCETLAAFIPAVVFLIHLSLRAADITPPEKREHHPITLTDAPEAADTVTLAVPVTAVPEPNVLVFLGLSLAALSYSRRHAKSPSPQSLPLPLTA